MAAVNELNLVFTSAADLKEVNRSSGGKLKPFIAVSVGNGTKTCTYVDASGGASPSWKYQLLVTPFSTTIEESTLHIHVVHAGGVIIGSAHVPLRGLVAGGMRTVKLKRPNGRQHGSLRFAVSFRQLAVSAVGDRESELMDWMLTEVIS